MGRKTRQEVYDQEKQKKESDMYRGLVKQKIDQSVVEEQVKDIMKVTDLWSSGYDTREIARLCCMRESQVKEVVKSRPSDFNKSLKLRIVNRLYNFIDRFMDIGLDDDKIKEADLRDLTGSVERLAKTMQIVDRRMDKSNAMTSIPGGMSDMDLMNAGKDAAMELKDIEFSKKIGDTNMKIRMTASKEKVKNVRAKAEVANVQEKVSGAVDAEVSSVKSMIGGINQNG